jgi:FkbM family methyltransferase
MPLRHAVLTALQATVDALLRPFGRAVAPTSVVRRGRRITFREALTHVKRLGLEPRTVIDVGVAAGTPHLYEAFPNARILLVEAMQEAEPHLQAIAARRPGVEYVIAAASSRSGSLLLHVHPDGERSSSYWESDYVLNDVERREVPAVTLDELRRDRDLEGPFLLKIDVQGAELDVLEGATETLAHTEYVVLETSLFHFFTGAPLVGEVIAYLNERGFVVYDVLSIQHRPLDGAVSMMDLAFVKESSFLRRTHRFQWEPMR